MPHCPSHGFTWSAKPTLEKQTSQLSLVCRNHQLGELSVMIDIRRLYTDRVYIIYGYGYVLLKSHYE